ncbi:MAG: glycosyltransferase family 2 protein [Beijerinckiaceae bacterium]|nr:glycosyltransferase family 2 protein [Beijerinckiaceae bacterium]
MSDRRITPLAVTVVIPAYNREELIVRAVRSALAQVPFPPAEVLVVDDASSDATARAAENAGARVIRHAENKGEGGARNTGIAQATQPWVALLDSDDEWLPEHLNRLWDRRSDHVLLASSALTRGAAPERLLGHPGDAPAVLHNPRQLFVPFNPIPASGVLVRRDILVELGGFRALPRGADLDMWVRVLEHGTGLVCPEPGYLYYIHEGQVSTDQSLMRTALRSIVLEYRSRPWWDTGTLRALDAIAAWDVGREQLSEGHYWRAVRHLLPILETRQSRGAVARMLVARRRLRRRLASGRKRDVGRSVEL